MIFFMPLLLDKWTDGETDRRTEQMDWRTCPLFSKMPYWIHSFLQTPGVWRNETNPTKSFAEWNVAHIWRKPWGRGRNFITTEMKLPLISSYIVSSSAMCSSDLLSVCLSVRPSIRPSIHFFYSANPISIKYTYIAFKVGAGGTKCFGGTNFQFLRLFLITKFLKFSVFK